MKGKTSGQNENFFGILFDIYFVPIYKIYT